jgi:hypothetical protein
MKTCDNGVERDMTADEIAERKATLADAEQRRAEHDTQAAAVEAARQSARAKLSALGLTADEIAALIP